MCPRDATALLESGVWSNGTVVRGKYRILSKVGEGGMAVVYKAVHVRFDEIRALKVMNPELAGDHDFVKRFMHEAVITRKLRHPNAVHVEDIDEAEDGRPFIVMEYIEGRSLKEVIHAETRMAVERVCSIAKQVAAALDAAHKIGMVHRDIKPANIVLLSEHAHGSNGKEVAKVLDFGIAKIKEAHLEESRVRLATLTGTGMVIGTPAYMSPEQAMGRRGDELDGRSDLYSLGIVMYQMLTGELPLKADSELQMLMAQINQAPPDIRTRRGDVPEPIARLVMGCLEKTADQRPATGQALIAEINYWEDEPVRLASARAEQERLARERAEQERLAREKAESERARPANVAPEPMEKPSGQPRPPTYATARPRSMATASAPWARPKVWGGITAGCAVMIGVLVWYFSSGSTGSKTLPQPTGQTSTKAVQQSPAHQPTSTSPSYSPAPDNTFPSQSAPPVAREAQPKQQQPAHDSRSQVWPVAAPVQKVPPQPSPDSIKAVKAAIALGDLHFNRGEYDDAVAEYKQGLNADPSNATLQTKIERAQKAKEAEERISHE